MKEREKERRVVHYMDEGKRKMVVTLEGLLRGVRLRWYEGHVGRLDPQVT